MGETSQRPSGAAEESPVPRFRTASLPSEPSRLNSNRYLVFAPQFGQEIQEKETQENATVVAVLEANFHCRHHCRRRTPGEGGSRWGAAALPERSDVSPIGSAKLFPSALRSWCVFVGNWSARLENCVLLCRLFSSAELYCCVPRTAGWEGMFHWQQQK